MELKDLLNRTADALETIQNRVSDDYLRGEYLDILIKDLASAIARLGEEPPTRLELSEYIREHLGVEAVVTKFSLVTDNMYKVYVVPPSCLDYFKMVRWTQRIGDFSSWEGPTIGEWTIGDGDDSLATGLDRDGFYFWIRILDNGVLR